MRFGFYTNCLAIMFIFMFIISYSNLQKYKKILIKIGILCLAILAFLFDPVKAWEVNGNYTDLYRFYYDMDRFSSYGWNCPNYYLKSDYSAIIISKILVYFVSKIGIYGLLQVTSLLIVYGVAYYVFFDYAKNKKLNVYLASTAFFIFICLYNYVTIITNIRMPIAMALYFLILYNDLIKKKNIKICLLGYFSLIFIHTSFILFFIIRVVVLFTTQKNWKFFAFIFLTYGLFISGFGNFIEKFSDNVFINAIFQKIYLYIYTNKSKDFYLPTFFCGILKIIMVVLLLKKHKTKDTFYYFCLIYLSWCCGSVFNYHFFHRATNFLCYLIPYMYMDYKNDMLKKFENPAKNNKISTVYLYMIFIIIVHLVYYFGSFQYNVLCF